MQDKNLPTDREKEHKAETAQTENNDPIIEDGVVYVANEDGTPFDTSDRTYVAVEGLEEALEEQKESEGDKGD